MEVCRGHPFAAFIMYKSYCRSSVSLPGGASPLHPYAFRWSVRFQRYYATFIWIAVHFSIMAYAFFSFIELIDWVGILLAGIGLCLTV